MLIVVGAITVVLWLGEWTWTLLGALYLAYYLVFEVWYEGRTK